MRIRVIGVGTRRGDDAAGLVAAEALARESWPAGVQVLTCERPDVALLDALEGTDAVVLVDAMRSGSLPGTVREIDQESLPRATALSSHALGVPEALTLALALGRMPARVSVVGIEGVSGEGADLSPAVRAAIPEACGLVRNIVAGLAESPA